MSRIRSVHPSICESETMARVSAEAERSFVRLWTYCDDEGRCSDNPKLLKAALLPLHDEVTVEGIEAHLEELKREGLIERYEVDGRRYIVVTSWHEFQHPQRAQKSKLPAPSAKRTRSV